jgi:Skp family chaperone for outer membrane proteins
MTDFGKAAQHLAQAAVDLDRRFSEKAAELDAVTDKIAARKAELQKLDAHVEALRSAVRSVHGLAKK